MPVHILKKLIKAITPYSIVMLRRQHLQRKRVLQERINFNRNNELLFEVHLTDHCNLNCKGCWHFSPLADKYFLDIAEYKKDCARLSELTGGKVSFIHLMGGEPLLHPDVCTICDISRHYFPSGKIQIVTNGILLLKQQESFWKNLQKNDIEIIITRYPVNINYEEIEKTARCNNVEISYWAEYEDSKFLQLIPLDLRKKQSLERSFLQCHRPKACTQLRNGKLYPCPVIPYIKYFNAHFHKNLCVTTKDYIDIYKVKDLNEILDFLARPAPFCAYCNFSDRKYDIPYGVSKKEISEWM